MAFTYTLIHCLAAGEGRHPRRINAWREHVGTERGARDPIGAVARPSRRSLGGVCEPVGRVWWRGRLRWVGALRVPRGGPAAAWSRTHTRADAACTCTRADG